jgi:hypothetical protein
MSRSPTGPGSWMLASTPAGRETSSERTCPGLDALTKVSPSASTARARPQQSEANLKALKRTTYD